MCWPRPRQGALYPAMEASQPNRLPSCPLSPTCWLAAKSQQGFISPSQRGGSMRAAWGLCPLPDSAMRHQDPLLLGVGGPFGASPPPITVQLLPLPHLPAQLAGCTWRRVSASFLWQTKGMTHNCLRELSTSSLRHSNLKRLHLLPDFTRVTFPHN